MAELAAFNREIQVRFLSGEPMKQKNLCNTETFRFMNKFFHSLREKHISSKDGILVRIQLREQVNSLGTIHQFKFSFFNPKHLMAYFDGLALR
jgi:hypothetical protein